MPPKYHLLAIVLLLTLVYGKRVWGQERYVLTGFQSEVDRYVWLSESRLQMRWRVGELGVFHRFTSEAFGTERLRFRDEERLDVYGQLGRFRFYGELQYYGQGQGLFSMLASGYRIALPAGAWIASGIGLVVDGKSSSTSSMRVDTGPGLWMQSNWRGPITASLTGKVHAQGRWYVIAPRRGNEMRLSADMAHTGALGALDLQVQYIHLRRDTYRAFSLLNREVASSSDAIESVLSDTLQGTLTTRFRLQPFLSLHGRLNYRTLLRRFRTRRVPAGALFFDTDYNQQELDASAMITYEHRERRLMVELRRGVGVEERRLANREALPPAQAALKGELLRQAGFDQAYLQLRTDVLWPLGARFRIQAGHLSRILRYDTPEGNPDDRDEVFHRFQIGLQYAPAATLRLRIQTAGSFYHTVYLKAARSAENTRQYHLRFIPDVTWSYRQDGELQLTSEVRSVYTVSDFPRTEGLSSDRSARELRYALRLRQRVTRDYELQVTGSWSRLNLGMLLWDNFAEVPLDTLHTYSGWLRVQQTGSHALSLGWRWLLRGETQQATSVAYEVEGNTRLLTRRGRMWIVQYGPTCTFQLPLGHGRRLEVQGWLQRQHVWKQVFGTLPEEDAPFIQAAARRGTVRWIPYLTLRTRWDF